MITGARSTMQSLRCIQKILDSINENAIAVRAEDTTRLDELLSDVRKFYESLFDRTKGAFRRRKINCELLESPEDEEFQSESETSLKPSPAKIQRKGLGKGSPGRPRKARVTKRQLKVREKRGISSDNSPSGPSNPAPVQPSLKELVRDIFGDDSSTSAHSPSSESHASRTNRSPDSQPVSPPPPAAPKPRETLGVQTRLEDAIKPVARIQRLFDATKDAPANGGELSAYWTLMNNWQTLSGPLEKAARLLHAQNVRNCTQSDIPREILHLTGSLNGTVCLQHLTGTLIKKRVDAEERAGKTSKQATLETLEGQLQHSVYQQYRGLMNNCSGTNGQSCEVCDEVKRFDDKYTRFHDRFEAGEDLEELDSEPDLADRPMHCNHAEVVAHDLKTSINGLGVSTLRRLYDFACTTPPLSPPTFTTPQPTDVIAITTKYFQQYCRERQIDDPIPSSWLFKDQAVSSIKADDLLETRKESVHFYDADSAEINLNDGDVVLMRQFGLSQPTKIRICGKSHDAQETDVSFRFYKNYVHSTENHMTTVITRHLGLGALRFVRVKVSRAPRLMLHIPRQEVVRDVYGRYLLDFVLPENSQPGAAFVNLTQVTARAGQTLSFYCQNGIERNIDGAMSEAILNRRGMFNLPGKVFTFPFRPWGIRMLWEGNSDEYAQYTPILNTPEQAPVEIAWQPSCSQAPTRNVNDGSNDQQNNARGDKYFFRIVECDLKAEALCYPAPSTIQAAGNGLFLKPHKYTIRKGQHLCLYAATPTTQEEIEDSGSSGEYAIHTNRTNTWYDAEQPDGINLGRYANQPHVLESLQAIRNKSGVACPPISDEDWLNEEKAINDACNAVFKCDKGQLVLVAKQEIPPSRAALEVFVNYGGLRSYWLALILKKRNDPSFSKALTDLLCWFLESGECNWSDEQKLSWAAATAS